MLQKRKPIRLQKIRDSARGEECTGMTIFCNQSPETVVFAHFGEAGEKGMSTKPDDTSGAYLCSACHDWLDGRTNINVPECVTGSKEWYWFRAMRRTWARLIEKGVLK